MVPDISEFSYGFTLVRELIDHYGLTLAGAPRFPTQNEEGKKGYDVELPATGLPIFIQFKRSDCLTTKTAKHARLAGLPYYRFHLRPKRHSRQHELLIALERAYPEVYYAAPLFHQSEELDNAYRSNTIAEKSIFVKPSSIGALPDELDHYIAASSSGANWYFCSQNPRRIEAQPSKVVLGEQLRKSVATRSRPLDDELFTELARSTAKSYIRIEVRGRVPTIDLDVDPSKLPTARRERVEEVRRIEASVSQKLERLEAGLSPAAYARETAITLLGCDLLVASK